MAFLQNGTWVPDQPLNNNANAMQAATQPAMRQAVSPEMSQMMQPQANLQMPMQLGSVGMLGPIGMGHEGAFFPQQSHLRFNPVMANILGSPSAPPVSNPTQAIGILPEGPPDPGTPGPNMMGSFPMPQFYQPRPLPQSVMQSVNNANPQSVQNFLSALHQSNMGGSNAWQNPQGIQGQGPQAGFQGFQQGQPPPPQPTQWQGYSQQTPQAQTGGYNNQAYQGGGMTKGGMRNGSPGMGGTPQQPQYQMQQTPPQQGQQPQQQGERIGVSQQGMSAASDINSKQNIASAEHELTDFLNQLGVYSYEYKDSKYGEGRRISPMAQEIEKSELGKAAISTNAEGYKIVDYGKLMGTQLAALALLNHKYNELESQLKTAVLNGLKEKGKR